MWIPEISAKVRQLAKVCAMPITYEVSVAISAQCFSSGKLQNAEVRVASSE